MQLTEQVANQGRCDFVADYARRFPVTIFLRLVDLPIADRERFLEWAEVMTHSGDATAKGMAFKASLGYLKTAIDARRRQPNDDVFSQIMASKVHGEPIGEAEMLGMVLLLVFWRPGHRGQHDGFHHAVPGHPS